MKRIRIIYLLLIFAICSCSEGGSNKGSLGSVKFELPPLPQKLSFASEPVPLDSLMVREWLLNEMLITQNMHSATYRILLNSKRYFAIIDPILKLHGVPLDFRYLAVAESGLNPEAYSPAKAAGMWQILASTARDFGLEVNNDIDERYHVEKSCHAACKYLLEAYEKFGSWTLAAASYNMGMNGLESRVRKQNQTDFYSLALPLETMRYLFRIVSYKIIFSNPNIYGYQLNNEQYYSLLPNYEVEVQGRNINWAEVGAKYGASFRTLRLLNPWIRDVEHHNRGKKVYKLKLHRLDDEK